jgi:hypothetical protein
MSPAQVHHKFKVFSGAVDSITRLGPGEEVSKFVGQTNVASKSIGVEFVEGAARALSLGYRDDEAGYPVSVETVPLGKVDAPDAANFGSLETAMRARAQFANVICHAEYVLPDGTSVMVFLVHA